MQHAAIPTLYKGIQFRSRLEAKYACLFDLLGWSWEYEPIDLNGWIPDFLIRAKYKPLLVEVKPILTLEKSVTNKIEAAFSRVPNTDPYEEIIPLSEQYDVLILALAPFEGEHEFCIGWITDDTFGDWQDACVLHPPDGEKTYGVGSGISGHWCDRISGLGGKENYGRVCADELQPLWAAAGNAVQWKAPK